MNIVRLTTPARAGERHRLAERQPGPVTIAIRSIRAPEAPLRGLLLTLITSVIWGRS